MLYGVRRGQFSLAQSSIRLLVYRRHYSARKLRSRPALPYSVALEMLDEQRKAGPSTLASVEERYGKYSREDLLARIQTLEAQYGSQVIDEKRLKGKEQKPPRPFDITRYPCRKIALRFAYDGEAYSGLEIQSDKGSTVGTPIETVESVLWRALCEARLVDDAQGGLPGVGWSRCGRTDRGVSAAGQVVAFWIRSRRVDQWAERRALERVLDEQSGADKNVDTTSENEEELETRRSWHVRVEQRLRTFIEQEKGRTEDRDDKVHADTDAEELPYVTSLNRILPPTIQVQAWSPVSPAFNARFDCQYRHYKYFFTAGAPFSKQTHNYGPLPPLNIEAMQRAAQRFLGEHDFRNFCKVDPSKQMDNFYRRIDGISIDPVGRAWDAVGSSQKNDELQERPDEERTYVLNLRGTAFLYHQVRHIIASLFLVGAGLESPSIIDELLNVRRDGVLRDRILMARLNGLILPQDDEQAVSIPRELPPALTHKHHNGVQSPELVQTYQLLRRKAEQNECLDEEETKALAPLRELYVYDRKPVYDMALDRPLVLWECGFRSEDIEWRAGTYDGSMDDKSTQNIPTLQINGPTEVNRALMHGIWTAQTITAEIFRHFTLALPSNDDTNHAVGYLPSSTSFAHASFPTLQSNILPYTSKTSDERRADTTTNRKLIPLGYGRFKTMPTYTPLRNVARQSTPAEKNEKWWTLKGQKRAAKIEERKKEQDM